MMEGIESTIVRTIGGTMVVLSVGMALKPGGYNLASRGQHPSFISDARRACSGVGIVAPLPMPVATVMTHGDTRHRGASCSRAALLSGLNSWWQLTTRHFATRALALSRLRTHREVLDRCTLAQSTAGCYTDT